MRTVLLSFIAFVWFTANAQQNAILIIHKGMSNHYIYPVVFATTPIEEAFSQEHLRVSKSIYIRPSRVQFVQVDSTEFLKVSQLLRNILETHKDTAEFADYVGSFDFVFLEKGQVVQRTVSNTPAISLDALYSLLETLDSLGLTNFDAAYTGIETLIKEVEHKPIGRPSEDG